MCSESRLSKEALGELKEGLRKEAVRLGLGKLRVTDAKAAASYPRYEEWIKRGYHGEMGYLARPDRLERRRDLSVILRGVQAVIVVTLPYWPGELPKEGADPRRGVISSYAWGEDYHAILGRKLEALAGWLSSEVRAYGEDGGEARWYVDTGAIQERDLGERAGLGFVGKNTLLIDPRFGSGFFLGEILTTVPLEADEAPPMPSCGTCKRCIEACPTQAFVGPYLLDARRCISYLTIELKGSIPVSLRPGMGNRIYGCDICQEVCPWMRFGPKGGSPLWGEVPLEVSTPDLVELLALDEAGFAKRFAKTAILRLKRARFLRNVAVALGNSGDRGVIPALERATHDPEPLIREHALWAIERLNGGGDEGGSEMEVCVP